MGKRTPQKGLEDWGEVTDLNEIVFDRRQAKRAGQAKVRRRDRRYENRLLRTTLDELTVQDNSD